MRWERLFGELEGNLEHAQLQERDALVAELREGEWASRSWLDGLQSGRRDVELAVRDVGVLTGRVGLANATLVQLASLAADHVIAANVVQWVRGDTRSPSVGPDTISSKLGWGHILREAQDDADSIRLILIGGGTVTGIVWAVGNDFVRVESPSGYHRDVPFAAICMATFPPHA